MNHSEQRKRLRAVLAGSKCLSPASVFDPLSARVAEAVGYEIGMLAGSVASNTTLAAPDLIVLTLTEFADQIRRIMRVSRLSLIVDADHGYGNALNVMRTIEELEHAGVSALSHRGHGAADCLRAARRQGRTHFDRGDGGQAARGGESAPGSLAGHRRPHRGVEGGGYRTHGGARQGLCGDRRRCHFHHRRGNARSGQGGTRCREASGHRRFGAGLAQARGPRRAAARASCYRDTSRLRLR